MSDYSDDDLYTTSRVAKEVVQKASDPLPMKKKKKVEDDFFAFHDEPQPKKRKKKKMRVDSEHGLGKVRLDTKSSIDIESESRSMRAERQPSKQRDVTPPPTEREDSTASRTQSVDEITIQDDIDDLDLSIPELSSSIISKTTQDYKAHIKLKPGLKEQFVLKLSLTHLNVPKRVELAVRGSTRVEKVLKVVAGLAELPQNMISDVVMLYRNIKLLNASQICNILTFGKDLEKDSEGRFTVEVEVMREALYEALKREKEEKLAKDTTSDDDLVVLDDVDEDKKFLSLDLHDLEKLAYDSLKNRSGIPQTEELSFKITLKASEKLKVDISVAPTHKIIQIKQAALEKFNLTNCKLLFDDEELDLQDAVADTELEEGFIVDVVPS